jgi:hypothetical protein
MKPDPRIHRFRKFLAMFELYFAEIEHFTDRMSGRLILFAMSVYGSYELLRKLLG